MIVVISKKWAMIFLCAVGLVVASFVSYEEFFAKDPFSETAGYESIMESNQVFLYKWNEYLEDCGSLRAIHNQYKVDNIFAKKYKFRVLEWEGYFMGYGSFKHSLVHHEGMMIKMMPTDTTSEDPDILIFKGNKKDIRDIQKISQQFNRGQKLIFKIRLRAPGDEYIPHLAEVEEISKAPGENLLDEDGLAKIERYKFKRKGMFGKKGQK